MTRSRWIIFILLCVVTLGGLVLMNKKDKVDVANVDASAIITATDTALGDNVYGNPNAKVVIFEYGDFQCPGCGAAFAQLKTIKETYKDTVAFVFRNFPLTTIHPNALAASTAAEAAGLQGKFWEMHDKLYQSQDSWSSVDTAKRISVFTSYAEEIGLDIDQFRTDLSSAKVIAKISRDRSLGSKLQITGTPTIYVNDSELTSEQNTDLIQQKGEKLMDKLDAVLKAKGLTPPQR